MSCKLGSLEFPRAPSFGYLGILGAAPMGSVVDSCLSKMIANSFIVGSTSDHMFVTNWCSVFTQSNLDGVWSRVYLAFRFLGGGGGNLEQNHHDFCMCPISCDIIESCHAHPIRRYLSPLRTPFVNYFICVVARNDF